MLESARRTPDLTNVGGLGEFPYEGVFATAGADNQNVHVRDSNSKGLGNERILGFELDFYEL